MTAQEIINSLVNLIFSKILLYISPVLFIFVIVLYSDRLIEFLHDIIIPRRRR